MFPEGLKEGRVKPGASFFAQAVVVGVADHSDNGHLLRVGCGIDVAHAFAEQICVRKKMPGEGLIDHRDALAGDDAQGIGSRSTAARIEHYCRGSFLKRAIPGAGEKQWEKEASLPPGLAGPR